MSRCKQERHERCGQQLSRVHFFHWNNFSFQNSRICWCNYCNFVAIAPVSRFISGVIFDGNLIRCTPIDSPWKALQICFWVRVDWMTCSAANSRQTAVASAIFSTTFKFVSLRLNAWPDRIGPNKLSMEQLKIYRYVLIWIKYVN